MSCYSVITNFSREVYKRLKEETGKWKNLVFAAALGLVIGVQSVMPVSAANAVPMDLKKCSECGTAVNVDVMRNDGTSTRLYKCDDPAHVLANCYVYKVNVTVVTRYICPKKTCGRSEIIDSHTEVEYRHVN